MVLVQVSSADDNLHDAISLFVLNNMAMRLAKEQKSEDETTALRFDAMTIFASAATLPNCSRLTRP